MVQSVQDILPQPDQRPAAELAADRRPPVKLFRKVTPRRSRPRYPDNTIHKKTMIGWLAPIRLLSRLADFLPWAALVAPGAVLNKDGSFQRTAKFRGPDLDSAVAAEWLRTAKHPRFRKVAALIPK